MSGTSGSAHVISCVQTRVDGHQPSARSAISEGSLWRWHGPTLRIDETNQALALPLSDDLQRLRSRARRTVGKFAAARGSAPLETDPSEDDDLLPGLIVSDGADYWCARAAHRPNGETLLIFEGPLPPANTDLRVVQGIDAPRSAQSARATICFTPGTRIDTPDGPKLVEELYPDDLVLTRDDGAQPILWMGLRQISGARMYAFPELRPVRIRAGALDGTEPRPDLLVSPDHRLLVQGDKCRALFGEPEVLVRARELIDDRMVITDHGVQEVVYIHLMFARHQVIRANGVETESFHPGEADLAHLNAAERDELLDITPSADTDPLSYGAPARRCLSKAEFAILGHDAPKRLI